MEIPELRELAKRTRASREMGIALLTASIILALFLFVPLARDARPAPVAAASTTPDAFDSLPPLTAKAAIVYDLATGATLYAKNAEAQLPLASLTKLLTVYAALSELSPDTPITIPADVMGLSAPHAFAPGETLALADLARLTLTASLNDGAAAIAEATALRAHTDQISMLAGAAAALDLPQTYALNGSGLDVSTQISGGYGSARDLARLAGALVEKAPEIAYATTGSSASATAANGTRFTVKNTDPIAGTVPRLLLSKTGYTDLAGGNLALVFDAALNHPVAVVVLGSTQNARFTDGMALVAAALAHYAGVATLK